MALKFVKVHTDEIIDAAFIQNTEAKIFIKIQS